MLKMRKSPAPGGAVRFTLNPVRITGTGASQRIGIGAETGSGGRSRELFRRRRGEIAPLAAEYAGPDPAQRRLVDVGSSQTAVGDLCAS